MTDTTAPFTLIDLETARRLLAQAMNSMGESFIYIRSRVPGDSGYSASCYNVPFGQVPRQHLGGDNATPEDPRRSTGCLVGTSLFIGGVPYSVLVARANSPAGEFDSYLTEEAVNYFTVAQNAQDRGESWGDSVSSAERSLPESVRAVPPRGVPDVS